ncbi:MAG: UbiD family decarboxylase [Deltaproteobacteria bacterium]|nr:UbiD family decarboxylase [Deltaproteobacteria bacterium]
MEPHTIDDLRQFIEAVKKVSDWREIKGADWNLEIGALIEATAELIPQPPMLIFNEIVGYPAGFRVLGLSFAAYQRVAVALGLPPDRSKQELVRLASRKLKSVRPIPPTEVSQAPITENAMTGDKIDLFRFPALRSHEGDGGRYIGTGDVFINADPESGYINMGTYRMQLHDRNLLGLWMSPAQHGRMICMRYWEQGKSCPVVATFGQDPLTFMASNAKIPWGNSELEYVGGLREKPLEIIKGPVTGLPIPAHAEIAIEGEVPPPGEQARDEGPFGEWPGYYSGGTIGTGEPQPVIRVKAVYHRNNPIIQDEAPLWTGAARVDLSLRAGLLWDQLENMGVQDVVGVYNPNNYLWAVAIKQRYAGHAKQAGHAVLAASASARQAKYIVVVDEDIDTTNLKEILWAMMTRVDPASDIEIVDGCWSTPLDPRMPPEKKQARDYTNSRMIFYAVRPFGWRDRFPKVSRSGKELRAKVVNKYSDLLPFSAG